MRMNKMATYVLMNICMRFFMYNGLYTKTYSLSFHVIISVLLYLYAILI